MCFANGNLQNSTIIHYSLFTIHFHSTPPPPCGGPPPLKSPSAPLGEVLRRPDDRGCREASPDASGRFPPAGDGHLCPSSVLTAGGAPTDGKLKGDHRRTNTSFIPHKTLHCPEFCGIFYSWISMKGVGSRDGTDGKPIARPSRRGTPLRFSCHVQKQLLCGAARS